MITNVLNAQTVVKLTGKYVGIKDPAFYVEEIIDARSNKEIIGIVQRGIQNEKQTAVLAGDVASVVKAAIGKLAVQGPAVPREFI